MEKKKILFIGIMMNCAGTEQSFLSLVNCFDFEKYEVDLLLAKNEGLFLELIPKQVNVKLMPTYGDLFLLSSKNAFSNLWNTFVKKNPLSLFSILPYFMKFMLFPKQKVKTATKLFCKMMQKIPPVSESYDAVLAYWGERTMFYMADKVKNAKKKIAWMHFEYRPDKCDDETYAAYFESCDYIVNVSAAADAALKKRFPEIAGKCVAIENIRNVNFIRRRSLEQDSFPDSGHFKGIRILTVGRIAEQKGIDMIPEILKKLKEDKYNLRWYVIGEGELSEKGKIIELALKCGVAEMLVFLGTTINAYPYMRDCDIYVQPSRFEGKPVAVEEAKIMRCPIVAANYLSAREQLADGKYGLIAETNPAGLHEKIKMMIDDPTLRENFAKTLSAENFGNESESDKVFDLL
ncbi:MAG: glycosyltransferase [Oscillospiraceae bacterium]|nr:glycosyltransferase [Oscillospiraceae bacterium]